eukprot:scaffold2966_cov143-Skeletonema_menzelii.AAC.3
MKDLVEAKQKQKAGSRKATHQVPESPTWPLLASSPIFWSCAMVHASPPRLAHNLNNLLYQQHS